jgi:dihydrofolate synthase/folylpolyglutamate synthase
MTIRSEAEAAAYLEGLVNLERRPDHPWERVDLEPIRALTARLGHPQQRLRVVHIAGSKGKGSTALFLESILAAAGRRVGVFTSPHLERWTERFRIGGREVEGSRLAAVIERLRPHVDALRTEGESVSPSFFDATTAAALLLFADEQVDFAVLEVGLGGRLDSTNVCDPALTCITSIELEHTDKLGSTLAAIAGEKAGILKPGIPAVLGCLPGEARAAIEARARQVGAPLVELGRDFQVAVHGEGRGGSRVDFRDGPLQVNARIRAVGDHQADNAALAVACARRALGDDCGGLADAVESGLASARLPGRIEVIGTNPTLVVDAAHTATSARALARALETFEPRRTRLVLSISSGKDTAAILDALLPLASDATLTRAEPTRSLDPVRVAEAARRAAPDLPLRIVPNPHLAVRSAREGLGEDDLLLATGSVYLAGIARRVLREGSGPGRVAVTRRPARSPVAGS